MYERTGQQKSSYENGNNPIHRRQDSSRSFSTTFSKCQLSLWGRTLRRACHTLSRYQAFRRGTAAPQPAAATRSSSEASSLRFKTGETPTGRFNRAAGTKRSPVAAARHYVPARACCWEGESVCGSAGWRRPGHGRDAPRPESTSTSCLEPAGEPAARLHFPARTGRGNSPSFPQLTANGAYSRPRIVVPGGWAAARAGAARPVGT